MNKKARVFAYSAIATSLIFGSAFISGCGDSGSTTPAFPASSSTSTPSTEPTPNDPSTPTTPATPSTPNTPNPEQPTEEESRQISLQFDSKSVAELQNLKVVKARYLVAKDLDDGEGQAKLLEGTLNLDSEAKEMAIKDVPQDANTITCFYYNDEDKVAAVSSTRLKLDQTQTQSSLGKVALGKLAKVETEEVDTAIHSVKGARWELQPDKTETAKGGYITCTLKLITADNVVIDDVIGLVDEIDLPQVAGEALMIRDPYRIGRFDIVQSSGGDYSINVTIKTANGNVSNSSGAFQVARNHLWEFSYNPQDNTVMPPTTVSFTLDNAGVEYELAPYRGSSGFTQYFEFYPNSQKNYVFDYKTDPEKYVAANCLATIIQTSEKITAILSNGCRNGSKFSHIDVFSTAIEPYELNEAYMKIGGYYSTTYRPEPDVRLNPHLYGNGSLITLPYAPNENGQNIYAGASGEIVARETGAFILGDMIKHPFPCRDDLQILMGEIPCFEEAFKDIVALYMSSQNIDVCRLAVKQCQGNWRKVNCLSSIGEEVGQYNKRDCLRQLINNDKWREGINCNKTINYDTLEVISGKSEHLTASLIFSGAFYDIMTGIAQRNIDAGMDSAIALKAAGQEAMELLMWGLGDMEKGEFDNQFQLAQKFVYRRAAIAMLKVDAKYNGCRAQNIIDEVMRSRNILLDGDDASTVIDRNELNIY